MADKSHGWHWGFGVGGAGMLVALIIFRLFVIPSMARFHRESGGVASWDKLW